MRLYLHEFPSSEGLCYVTFNQIREIKFKHYEISSNKHYTIFVRFKWCDVKVNVVNIELLRIYTVVDLSELELFKQQCIELFSLFNKYNEYYWISKAQLPKRLITSFFVQLIELHNN